MSKRFQRQDSVRILRLGKKRKKKRVWRKPKGKDSKMRIRRRAYPDSPLIGYKSSRKSSGKILGLKPVLVHNVKELDKLDRKSIAILARIGAKKKIEVIKRAQEKGIKILNVRETK